MFRCLEASYRFHHTQEEIRNLCLSSQNFAYHMKYNCIITKQTAVQFGITNYVQIGQLVRQFSCSVKSHSWLPHELQHARLPGLTPTPGTCSKACPSSWWYHPTISSSVIPFSSCLQSFPASGSFLTSQFFTLGGQSIGVSTLASALPMNIQDWFPLGLTGLISL